MDAESRGEWKPLEGYKALYVMMASQPTLPSTDGSSNRNTPERCPSPLYSLDPVRERHKILRCYQYKRLKHIETKVKEETEETYLRADNLCKKEEIHTKIITGHRDTRASQRNLKSVEKEDGNVKIKDEAFPPEISTDPENSRVTHRSVKTEEKEEGHIKIKQEVLLMIKTDPGDTRTTQRDVKAEEDSQVKAKKKILEIGMDGRYRWYTEEHPSVPQEGEMVDNDITAYVLEEKAIMPNLKPLSYKREKMFACPECGKCFSRKYDRILHRRIHTGQKPFPCSECGKSFPFKSNLEQHLKTHTTQSMPFSCSECGMRFRTSRILATHKRVHIAKTVYKCSQCGQAFIKKLYLKRHERVHIGLKPY
ncbi:uncharacterized protein [Aquarana catesbeiana]|uniref:uncharacterized protein isoform X2 n=1 Tax=Aquarana catesbeiana TaxID=8400 RepID=UPI003CC971AF